MALQKEFRGLADLVGLYEGGQLKLDLNRLLQPAIDILPFVEPPRWRYEQKSIDTLGEFDVIGDPVPADEMWLVRFLGIASSAVVPSGKTVMEQPRIATANSSQQFGLSIQNTNANFAAVQGNTYLQAGVLFNPLLVLTGGDQIGWFTSMYTGGPWTLTATMGVQYHRIQV